MEHPESSRHTFKSAWIYYRGWKWLIFIGLALAFLLSSYLVFIAKTTSVDTLQEALQSQTVIYDQDDQLAGTLNSQKGTYVPLDAISSKMVETVISVEDRRFYEHTGFDTLGMGRAFVRLIMNRDTSGGGGSTITQQLVKNAFLTLDQTLQRKLKEFFLALEVEKTYSKDQILEMYLNHAYFGNGVWGVEDASMKYFGHSASSLSWNESMVLTGILKGPSIYNPIDDYDAAMERRNVVAQVVYNQHLIDESDYQWLQDAPIELYDAYVLPSSHEYPFYFDAVITEASQLAEIPEADLMGKGYRIYTHLNPYYQQAIDSAYANTWVFPAIAEDQPTVQSASVVVDPNNGGVMAVYGGRGDYVFRGFNRAIDMRRSPGSTIKPLAIYTLALERGYHIHSVVPDRVEAYGEDDYAPENYNHYTEPGGETELYYALAQSKNTTAVHLLNEFGMSPVLKKLNQFGIQVAQVDQSLTLALGAMQEGVTPLELANAYSAFANQGVRHESSFIRRIEDAGGKVVYENERPTKHLVMTKNVAMDMTSMMLDTYGGFGTGYGAGPDYGLLAGKTGSTEIAVGNMGTRDRWMVGYTPDFVIATWVGLDEVGQVTLDELMPTGLGALFNQQTTLLMNQSPQTPFEVTFASEMTEDTNYVNSTQWQDDAGEWLDDMWHWTVENGTNLWDQAVDISEQGWRQIQEWLP